MPQWAGKKPGEKFTYRGPKGTGQGYLDKEGVPRNEKGEVLYGKGHSYPVEGLKSEIKAKLASGQYEYTGPLPKEARAVGDKQTTTMTSRATAGRPTLTMSNTPLKAKPLRMTNTPLARAVATMINRQRASKPRPLVNTPLRGTPRL